MKTLYKTLFCFLFPLFLFAESNPENGKFTKEKVIENQFKVNADATLKINNSYGNVDITSWNKNEIEIKIIITTNGDNEQEVQKRLDEITVSINGNSSLVTAVTNIPKNKSNWTFWGSKQGNVTMKINYKVKMPLKNNLDINNNYGAISLNKLEGNTKITCDYGKLILGELSGKENFLKFNYTSNSTISYISNGTLHADYSGFVLDLGEKISFRGDYTKSEFKVVENLDYSCDYGKLIVGQSKIVSGRGNYVSKEFDIIGKIIDVKSNYGKITINKLNKDFQKVIINSNYTSVKIGFDPTTSFNLNANITYAQLKGKELLDLSTQTEKNTSKAYIGTYGNKNNGGLISINSNYGGITLIKN